MKKDEIALPINPEKWNPKSPERVSKSPDRLTRDDLKNVFKSPVKKKAVRPTVFKTIGKPRVPTPVPHVEEDMNEKPEPQPEPFVLDDHVPKRTFFQTTMELVHDVIHEKPTDASPTFFTSFFDV
jgi:hypothetical protein